MAAVFSLQPYRALVVTPDLAAAVLASVIGRLPIGITGFAILLYVQAETRSFATAGALSAIYVLGLAAAAPFLGRLIDRAGPRRVLTVSAIVHPAMLVSLIALVSRDASLGLTVLCAAGAGASLPPITVCMRALYPQLVGDEKLLHTAYSLDAALIEAVFILGPMVVSVFAALDSSQSAIALAAICATTGSFLFLRSSAVRRWKTDVAEHPRGLLGPLRHPALLVLFLVTLLNASAFGLIEVAITGLATMQGYTAAAGVILGLASVGTTLGVLIYGSRSWWPPLARQFFYALLLMASGILLIAPIQNLVLLACVIVIAAAPTSVALAITSLLISKLAPRAMLAESFTWMATFLLTGISLGIAGGGVLVEAASPFAALILASALAAFAALLVRLRLN
ncbi:MAG: MFS transporter [Burkholderiales bacterium]